MKKRNAPEPIAPIEVCYLDLTKASAAITMLWPLLSVTEKEKALAYRFANDRNRFILGRGAIRRWVGQRLNIKAEDLRIVENEYGKPMVSPEMNFAKIDFNISHSGDLIALALGTDRPIGIDIEQIRPLEESDQLTQQSFDANEKQLYFSANRNTRSRLFLNTFSQKEACLKQIGVGLSLPMSQVHTACLAITRSRVTVDLAPLGKHVTLEIHPLALPTNYVGALATANSEISIRYVAPQFLIAG